MPGTRKECVLGAFLLIFRAAEQAGSATFSRTGLLEAHRGLLPVWSVWSDLTCQLATIKSSRQGRWWRAVTARADRPPV